MIVKLQYLIQNKVNFPFWGYICSFSCQFKFRLELCEAYFFFKQELKYVEYFMFSFLKWNLKEKELKESHSRQVASSPCAPLSCKLADTQCPSSHPLTTFHMGLTKTSSKISVKWNLVNGMRIWLKKVPQPPNRMDIYLQNLNFFQRKKNKVIKHWTYLKHFHRNYIYIYTYTGIYFSSYGNWLYI